MPLNYQQAFEYIHSFDDPYQAAIRDHGKQTWGLAGIRDLLARIGNPHLICPVIHVAGTKGKGSTAAFIAQGMIESGLKTGLYTSPHLEDWRERIQINRGLIPEESVTALVEEIQPHAEAVPGLSAFEVTTALAFLHFAHEACDAAVIEVGLGGRLDATNVVEPLVAVITSISLDHTQLLGSTLAEIAAEKVAIIKSGVSVVSAPQAPEALSVIAGRADEMGSRLTLVGRDWQSKRLNHTLTGSRALIGPVGELKEYQIRLAGHFQIENAAVALSALVESRRLGLPVTDEGCALGLARAEWPGRVEVVSRSPLIVLDGAHNPYSVAQLLTALSDLLEYDTSGAGHWTMVFGCMADKDVEGMIGLILPFSFRVIFTGATQDRAADPADLLARAVRWSVDNSDSANGTSYAVELLTAPTVTDAVDLALESRRPIEALCVTGSLAVVAEARRFVREQTGLIGNAKQLDREPS